MLSNTSYNIPAKLFYHAPEVDQGLGVAPDPTRPQASTVAVISAQATPRPPRNLEDLPHAGQEDLDQTRRLGQRQLWLALLREA